MKTRLIILLATLVLAAFAGAEIKSSHIQPVLRLSQVKKCIERVAKKHKVSVAVSTSSFNDTSGPHVDFRGYSMRDEFAVSQATVTLFTSEVVRGLAKSIADVRGDGPRIRYYSTEAKLSDFTGNQFRMLYSRQDVQGVAIVTVNRGEADNVTLSINVYEHRKLAKPDKQ